MTHNTLHKVQLPCSFLLEQKSSSTVSVAHTDPRRVACAQLRRQWEYVQYPETVSDGDDRKTNFLQRLGDHQRLVCPESSHDAHTARTRLITLDLLILSSWEREACWVDVVADLHRTTRFDHRNISVERGWVVVLVYVDLYILQNLRVYVVGIDRPFAADWCKYNSEAAIPLPVLHAMGSCYNCGAADESGPTEVLESVPSQFEDGGIPRPIARHCFGPVDNVTGNRGFG